MASTISADMILNCENPFEEVDIPDIARELLASFVHSSQSLMKLLWTSGQGRWKAGKKQPSQNID
jgi:hypothetical protein